MLKKPQTDGFAQLIAKFWRFSAMRSALLELLCRTTDWPLPRLHFPDLLPVIREVHNA
jgi:hypothetical protein